jgi:hypothetical protein
LNIRSLYPGSLETGLLIKSSWRSCCMLLSC